MVGVSTFTGYSCNERSMLSLGDRRRRARRARHRGHAGLGRGRRRVERSPWSSATCRPRSARPSRPCRTPRSSAPRIDRPSPSMAGDVELVGLYWTVSGPVEVHVGREWSLFDWRDRCAEAREGRLPRHRDLARRPRARARDAQLREMKADLRRRRARRYLELEFLMDWFLDPATSAARRPTEQRARCSSTPPPSSAPTTSRSATSPARRRRLEQVTERFAELCADAASTTRREDRLRVHAVRRQRADARRRAGGRRRRRRGERRHRDRHVAHGQARHRARRPAPHPARVPVLGRAERRPARGHGRPDRRDREPPPPARRGRVRRARLRRGLPRHRLPRPVGSRGALRGAAQPADGGDLPAGLRDDQPPSSSDRHEELRR